MMVVNPRATSTSPRVANVIIEAFSGELDLDLQYTDYRGHGIELGALARERGLDVVITLGGDGVVNEVINGMLSTTHDEGSAQQGADDLPMLATVPGGSANVFARSLGLAVNPVAAAGQLLQALRNHTSRVIGLGIVQILPGGSRRWFATNAGMGLDAEVIAAMERERTGGHSATPGRYLAITLQEYLSGTDRRTPHLTIQRAGEPALTGIYLAIVQNTAPWTYIGALPVNPSPAASFDSGLDLFALRSLSVAATVRATQHMLTGRRSGSSRSRVLWHDQAQLRITADQPMALQVDGEGAGSALGIDLLAVPGAIRVVC
jgi:diacylglycerol kinase family enzyme